MTTRLVFLICLWFGTMASSPAGEVLVSAAASLTNAFQDLATAYTRQHPDTRVLTSFGASDVVLRQILEGAPADLFASADEQTMDRAQASDAIVPETRVPFASNQLVLIVARHNPAGIHRLADLHRAQRVALGNPQSVPVGRYTQAALQQAGQWDTVQARQILGQNVRQVLSYVQRGEVDAGFVFATDAALRPDDVKIVQTVPTPQPIIYPIALVNRPDRAPQARDFLDFIRSEAGQAILQRYGFSQP